MMWSERKRPKLLARATPMAGLLMAFAACGGNADASASGDVELAVPVRAVTIESRNTAPRIVGTGTLAGKEEIKLSFKIGGVVARIDVDEGAQVAEGAVLAELSPTEITSEVEKATQARQKTQRDLERVRELYRDSVATLEQMQDATTALEVAESNLKIARFNRDWSIIRAPAVGVVLRKHVEASQLVTPGTTVLVLRTARKGLVLRVGLADRDAMRLRLGDRASVRFDALPGETFAGTVTQLASAADAQTGTYEVEVAVRTRGRTLASGLVGAIDITPRAVSPYPIVPVEALVEGDGDSATVYVLSADGARALRRRVTIAFLDVASAAVASGLTAGDRVITAGAAYVSDSARVRVDSSTSGGQER
jgi:membrane fusion protein, multidrug efflux system